MKALSGIERPARLRLDRLEAATADKDLFLLPSDHFEALGGKRKGQYSVRINDRWRICFEWPEAGRDRKTSRCRLSLRSTGYGTDRDTPGERLAEDLNELGMSAAELARKLGVPTNRVTGILNGQRAITGDTALRLAHFFGTSPEFWLNLQSLYELRVARKKAGSVIRTLPRLRRPKRVPA